MFVITQQAFLFQKCIQFSMGALFIYDIILTLPREIEVVWSKAFRVSTLVYLSIRYLPAVGIAYALAKSPVKDHNNRSILFLLVLNTIVRAGITTILTTRICVICTYHRRLLTCCIALWGLSSLIFEIFTFSLEHPTKYLLATIATRLSFEIAVVIVTTAQSVRQFSFRQAFDGTTMVGFFVMNGVAYFAAVFALEITSIGVMTQIRPQDQLRGSSGAFPLPLVGSLVSRLHLNVRGIMYKSNEETHEHSQMSTINFADNKGNRDSEGNSV